jgi:hypothetical protein
MEATQGKATYPNLSQIGIELEGGWRDTLFEDVLYSEDVSVPAPEGYHPQKQHWGEVVSPPLSAEGEDEKWLLAHYPLDVPAPTQVGTNQEKSAGIHFHLSFPSALFYEDVMSAKFFNFFLRRMHLWGAKEVPENSLFRYRLEGKNRFALRKFTPRQQVGVKKKNSNAGAPRRTVINYPHGLHSTVEVRLFPTFTEKAKALSALVETKKTFNDYISLYSTGKEKVMERVVTVGEVSR